MGQQQTLGELQVQDVVLPNASFWGTNQLRRVNKRLGLPRVFTVQVLVASPRR